MAALSPWRGSPIHFVAPVLASRQKNCPLFLFENPKSRSPCSTGELMYIDTASVFHTSFVPPLVTATAVVPCARPDKISMSLYTSGVTMFCSYGVLKGIFHSSAP